MRNAFDDAPAGGVKITGNRGHIEILNVGDGDTKLSFDPKDDAERRRAAKIVSEMLRLGFAIMIEVEVAGEKLYKRVHEFREDTCEYVIFGEIPEKTEIADAEAEQPPATTGSAPSAEGAAKGRKSKRAGAKFHTIPAASTRAVGIARSAGG